MKKRCEDCGKRFDSDTGNDSLCPSCAEDMIDMMFPNGRDEDAEDYDD